LREVKMELNQIHNFNDFYNNLCLAGFSTGGINNEGVFGLSDWYGKEILWHTEESDTDPWEWRIRVLNEKEDVAYGKIFLNKSGYITRQWYPYFLAVRRPHENFYEAYREGRMSSVAKRIMDVIENHKKIALHEIKHEGNFTKEEKSVFDRALCELQMKMFITMCGSKKKQSEMGSEFGWNSTVFCSAENFFGEEVFREAGEMKFREAYETLEEQIFKLNPQAEDKKVKKYILG